MGGYYFNEAIELQKALEQSPEQFRTVSDLNDAPSQILDANENAPVIYLNFSRQAECLKRQLGFDLDALN